MKIKIICKSLLLEKALENFLKDYISYSDYDIIISDKKINDEKLLLIGRDIQKPFSKEKLFEKLHHWIKNNTKQDNTTNIEKEMQELLKEYTSKINQLAKRKYEQRLT